MKPIFIDPDFRKDTRFPNCCRCGKKVKEGAGVKVTLDNDWLNIIAMGGEYVIGKDCAKKVGLTVSKGKRK